MRNESRARQQPATQDWAACSKQLELLHGGALNASRAQLTVVWLRSCVTMGSGTSKQRAEVKLELEKVKREIARKNETVAALKHQIAEVRVHSVLDNPCEPQGRGFTAAAPAPAPAPAPCPCTCTCAVHVQEHVCSATDRDG